MHGTDLIEARIRAGACEASLLVMALLSFPNTAVMDRLNFCSDYLIVKCGGEHYWG